jgi:hypothetical protein
MVDAVVLAQKAAEARDAEAVSKANDQMSRLACIVINPTELTTR